MLWEYLERSCCRGKAQTCWQTCRRIAARIIVRSYCAVIKRASYASVGRSAARNCWRGIAKIQHEAARAAIVIGYGNQNRIQAFRWQAYSCNEPGRRIEAQTVGKPLAA